MLVNAYEAITLCELWNYMKKDTYSYMFSNDVEIQLITDKMNEIGCPEHSGYSFGWTMRNMQYIAQNGLDKYRESRLNK